MSILAEKLTNSPVSGKRGSAQAVQKNSAFPDLKSPDEFGRVSPQRPLINLWAEFRSPRHESVSKLKAKDWTENTLLKGISEKVTKLYRNLMVVGDE